MRKKFRIEFDIEVIDISELRPENEFVNFLMALFKGYSYKSIATKAFTSNLKITEIHEQQSQEEKRDTPQDES